jgi:hypothetical protein
MPTLSPTPRGVRLELDRDEATLLRSLLQEMRVLLEADIPRIDPVVTRLFPDAYEDAEEADKYRTMVGDELRDNKLETIDRVEGRLGRSGAFEGEIERDEAPSWLRLLTDLRLAIGTRLGVTEEGMDAPVDPEDPDAPAWSVMHWLGWFQGSMLEAMDEEA